MNAELETLMINIRKEFPGFEIIQKSESRKMKAIGIFLKLITFGNMRDFMAKFVTTVGEKVYVPSMWAYWPAASKMCVLRHERIHMRQRRKYKFLFPLLYLFVFFPIGLAYFRAKFEKEAYEESLRAYAEYYGIESLSDPVLRNATVSYFTTADYCWMWPFKKSIERWYDGAVVKIRG